VAETRIEPAAGLEQLLARKAALGQRAAATPQFGPRLQELRAWQAGRLAGTYKDLRGDPRYARAVEFFLSDLYGPRDFSPRDRELARAWRYLKRSLPGAARAALERAIELEVLSAELDHLMVEALPPSPLSAAGYAKAYRAVGQRAARERQIELVIATGANLDSIVRHAWVGAALRLARAPAHAAGFGVLQDFLERGFAAFAAMHDAGPFLSRIRERETALMNELLAGGGGEARAGGPEHGLRNG
jgi:hypothetical protein